MDCSRILFDKSTHTLASQRTACLFFPDLVSKRFRNRVANACGKYIERGFPCCYVKAFDELYMPDVERSGDDHEIDSITRGYGADVAITLQLHRADPIKYAGSALSDVYQGEQFVSIIEMMSCFRTCPGGCKQLVLCQQNSPTGCFCDDCFKRELEKQTQLKRVLSEAGRDIRCLVTGARCGLGKKIADTLSEHGLQTFGTTRFPSDAATTDTATSVKMLRLDLKDPQTFPQIRDLLEAGDINVLVLSASETLHFPTDDQQASSGKGYTGGKDWTNDFNRPNSGVWHKTLDRHSPDEIMSPLIANVAGTSTLLSYFLKGVRKARAVDDNRMYCCIVVTSFEGRFESKTPFHPITNGCKAALEQIVWTVQSQARFLDCPVL